jgi:uncharacterized protein (DUF2267 family)
MSTTGLDVFDRTVQVTNIWLNEIMDELGPDRHFAWHVLGAVIRPLRDQLPPDMAVHLGAELPILVRGTYYDGWHTPAERDEAANADEFLRKVSAGLATTRVVAPEAAVRAVFAVLSRHLDPHQVTKVRNCLSESVRTLWPDALTRDEATPSMARRRKHTTAKRPMDGGLDGRGL